MSTLKKFLKIKNSHIDRNYAYKILRSDKKPIRDKILQLCIGANFTLSETNKALKLDNYIELYPNIMRDSVIILGLNKKLNILDINELLFSYNLSLLCEE